MTTNIPPTPPSRTRIPSNTMSDAEKARILAETEKAMTEEVQKNKILQKAQDAGQAFMRNQKVAKQTNGEVADHNDSMSYRRRIILIVAASLVGLGIILKVLELTVMGGW